MEAEIYKEFVEILKEELVPAMGCTEPIAIAYCASVARKQLTNLPTKVVIHASANIIKNVKSVVVPHTNGKKGIAAACAIGIIAGDSSKELEVIANVTESQINEMYKYLDSTEFLIEQSDNNCIFHINVELFNENEASSCEIAGSHTNIITISKDNRVIFSKEYSEEGPKYRTNHKALSIEKIIEFADNVNIDDVKATLDRQIEYNYGIAKKCINENWGANIGSIILKAYGNSVSNRAKAYAAAGSDGRMNGCEMPVVINSGSGNQGIAASVPVIVYAEELNVEKDALYRALVVSNLVTIHLKTGIGCLSAYCGATSAGVGAGAGITYLYGGKYKEIAHTIVNAIAIDSGMICDGAKASCAAKIASAVGAGLLGMQMNKYGTEFVDGDGIVVKGVENTIDNVSYLASKGMKETDKTIIKLMTKNVK